MSERPTVLVVDDDEGIRRLGMSLLTRRGFKSEGAANGKEAVRRLRSQQFDAVVLDLLMPEKDGIETLMDIKTHQPETYVIAISGGGRIAADEYLQLATMCGADVSLRKPFSFGHVADLLEAATENRGV